MRIAVVERNQRVLGEHAAAALLETLEDSGPVVVLAMSWRWEPTRRWAARSGR